MIPLLLALLASALLPPIDGVVPPEGTMLIGMDITPAPPARRSADVYRIASPLPPRAFSAAYAAAARRAGYETSVSARIVVAKRPAGGGFRLVLQPRGDGSTGVLTVSDSGAADPAGSTPE